MYVPSDPVGPASRAGPHVFHLTCRSRELSGTPCAFRRPARPHGQLWLAGRAQRTRIIAHGAKDVSSRCDRPGGERLSAAGTWCNLNALSAVCDIATYRLLRGLTDPRDAGLVQTTMPIIEIQGLSKSYQVYQKQEGLRASVRGLWRRQYREIQAVRGIDLTVEQGEFVAFLGPNGAGKTTTLKLLSGVINPTSGVARVMGFVPWKRENAYRRRFALVMGQKNQLWWDLPAQESFRLHQQIYTIAPEHSTRRWAN